MRTGGKTKTLKKAVVSVFVIVALCISLGIAYVFISGQSEPTPVATQTKKDSSEPSAIKPKPPSPNATVGVSMGALTSPVKPGSNASYQIRTTPTAMCSISVSYNGVTSKDSGLSNKVADEFGTVTWSWAVESTTPEGLWPIQVTCTYNKQSAVFATKIEVSSKAETPN